MVDILVLVPRLMSSHRAIALLFSQSQDAEKTVAPNALEIWHNYVPEESITVSVKTDSTPSMSGSMSEAQSLYLKVR